MLDDNQRGLLRFLIYPVQFDENPTDEVDRVLKITFKSRKNISRGQYLYATQLYDFRERFASSGQMVRMMVAVSLEQHLE